MMDTPNACSLLDAAINVSEAMGMGRTQFATVDLDNLAYLLGINKKELLRPVISSDPAVLRRIEMLSGHNGVLVAKMMLACKEKSK